MTVQTDTQLKVPLLLLDELSAAQSVSEVLKIYARWSNILVASDRCVVALADDAGDLRLQAFDGTPGTPMGTIFSNAHTMLKHVYVTLESCIQMDLASSEYADLQMLHATGYAICYNVPLVVGDLCLGVIGIGLKDASRFHPHHFDMLQSLGRCLATYLLLFKQMERLTELAMTDPLTATSNRRMFDLKAATYWSRWVDDQSTFAILMLDLDFFKQINDHYGHDGGDLVLQESAARAKACLRDGDTLFRLGGEEFALLIPALTQKSALALAERLRCAIGEKPVQMTQGKANVTVSIGVALSDGSDADFAATLRRADQALYDAKTGGRNRVALAGPAAAAA